MSFVKPAINHMHNLRANHFISHAHINCWTHFFSCHAQMEQPREIQTGTNKEKKTVRAKKKKSSCVYDKLYSTFTSSCFAHTGLLQLALPLCAPCSVRLAHIQNAGRMHENIFKKIDVVFLEHDFIHRNILFQSPPFFLFWSLCSDF